MEIEKNIPKIRVCIRKRPLMNREIKKGYKDIIQVENNSEVLLRELRVKLDLTKYIEEHYFKFDLAFSENKTNGEVYEHAIKPLVEFFLQEGKSSCFAYGQTGSGKTYTMMGNRNNSGLFELASRDIFHWKNQIDKKYKILISYFEIYCGKLYDLFNEKNLLQVREDKYQNINVIGLNKIEIDDPANLVELIQYGNSLRVTSQTGKNEDSSRSHAILQFHLILGKKRKGLFSFIDLAGNERGGDTYGHDN